MECPIQPYSVFQIMATIHQRDPLQRAHCWMGSVGIRLARLGQLHLGQLNEENIRRCRRSWDPRRATNNNQHAARKPCDNAIALTLK